MHNNSPSTLPQSTLFPNKTNVCAFLSTISFFFSTLIDNIDLNSLTNAFHHKMKEKQGVNDPQLHTVWSINNLYIYDYTANI